MKLLIAAGLLIIALLVWKEAGSKISFHSSAQKPPEFTVTDRVITPNVTHFGVNLGTWTSWGADQFSSNVLKNPGFEGIVDRAIAIPEHGLPGSFDDSPAWLARPNNFWNGGTFDVRSGSEPGVNGRLTRSIARNLMGLPEFLVDDESKLPAPGDVVALTKEWEDLPPTQWWLEGDPASFAPVSGDTRPGSPGKRSLMVSGFGAKPAAVVSYLDAIGSRSGKLLPLDGTWTLSFWMKSLGPGSHLRVTLVREGATPVFTNDVPATAQWSNAHFQFHAKDDGPPGAVSLRFQVSGSPVGKVLLDDVDLRRSEDSNFPFRHEVVTALERLHPRYLRDWQGQLGDTLANRIASPFARKAYRYRPGDLMATDYGYGLRDFLDLCVRVHADPWIIVPTTFSDAECAGLGDYLQAQPDARGFREVMLEFGNENWNLLFRPAGIPDAIAHGQAADRCLALVRDHAAQLPVKLVINAQHANVPVALDFARESQKADIEAVAPYFLLELARNTPSDEALASLFAGDGDRMEKIAAGVRQLHKQTAIYEVNLHTLSGTASGEERTPIVAGLASGTALAKAMLDSLREGVNRQCVYSLAGFDNALPKNEGFVPLFGIMRDLGATQRIRPSGLALELMNQALDGAMYRVDSNGSKKAAAYAFHSSSGWAIALVSMNGATQTVTVNFPTSLGPLPQAMFYLNAASYGTTNEQSNEVTIDQREARREGGRLSVDLPPWSLAVVLPRAAQIASSLR